MARSFEYKHPTTYAEIVEAETRAHARRRAELAKAEKMIRAIESDLKALCDQRVPYAVSSYSMCLVDVRDDISGRAQYAVRIAGGIFFETRDLLPRALVALGWIAERVKLSKYDSTVVFRRPKTQVRVQVDASVELGTALTKSEACT
ncbi:hypothetical protein R69658_05413 [Paraburkholderia aspalathi]|uniref:Uncharacterized protein n=1 Tax=Paraburkholderia aspalathi TaxID=1324617 RepID=A0ABN7MNF7_9BURK|nr:ACP synthase [Paraburkholderia aspalathi]MBK3821789.1 ACP synthase [Paraburkholderia aspalathi]MBK3833607.1 ACP synthase [Paraburkholderia aspalathi]MBK3863330.1 ACP synthase [Paraburkholderia aspalathi]CAE6811237.1 hypothetical protein R69658_05413 [Paraburkholderia aspalathi]